jgi:hypothetical protein
MEQFNVVESNWIENRCTYASCYAKTIAPEQEEHSYATILS